MSLAGPHFVSARQNGREKGRVGEKKNERIKVEERKGEEEVMAAVEAATCAPATSMSQHRSQNRTSLFLFQEKVVWASTHTHIHTRAQL